MFNGPGPQTDMLSAYDDAIAFMRRNRSRPFFLDVWTHEPHVPHYPPAGQRIEKVLAELRRLGLEKNTIIVFSSDNGPEVIGTRNRNRVQRGDPDAAIEGTSLGTWYGVGETGGLRGRKRALYEGGVRVPFIVRWPGKIPAGRHDRSTVMSAVDLLPTFAAAAGATLPNTCRGDGRAALYDLFSDRAEARDVASAEPALTERLSRLARDWRATFPNTPSPSILSAARSSVTG